MLIDTVGLVRRLPHNLVQAFHSTLEQAAGADIILNICDASSPEADVHLKVTKDLLEELGCKDTPIIPVLNKCDLLPKGQIIPFVGKSVRICAKTGAGVDKLLYAIERNLPNQMERLNLLLPFSKSSIAAQIRRDGRIENEEYTERGLKLTAQIPLIMDDLIKDYIVE